MRLGFLLAGIGQLAAWKWYIAEGMAWWPQSLSALAATAALIVLVNALLLYRCLSAVTAPAPAVEA